MEFIILAVAHFLALLSPGPDFFLIMQAGLRLPLRYGMAISLGIALANGIYLACAILGVQFLQTSPAVMLTLRYLGATYLLYLGIMLLRSPRRQVAAADHPEAFLLHRSLPQQVAIGFMSGILNPKNGLFYLSLFTTLISPDTSLFTRTLYGIWMTCIVFFWDSFITYVIHRLKAVHWMTNHIYLLEKLSGTMLTVFGIWLPFA